MEAKRYLKDVGEAVTNDFVKNRSILSYEEYLALFLQDARGQARNAAQYLHDVMEHFGTEQVDHPRGKMRRFKLFDQADGERLGAVAGQEEVQNDLYRILDNFVRSGRINKLILLHGPNGSAKSSLVDALKRAMEAYSRLPQGALYRINWIFPTQKLVKGSIGFADSVSGHGELATYAHLDVENIEVRMACELRDHPLFVVPRAQRRTLLEGALGRAPQGAREFVLSDYVLQGELCHKCRRIYASLLAANQGDYLKVLRHVQVERFYISRRYQVGSVTLEPQMSVDAAYHPINLDRSQANLPPALHNAPLFEAHGALITANRGLIEYSDLLKRPLEAFKYLLGFSETGEVPLEHMILQLDEVLIASSNEKHLSAFKDLPDFASFKGRIELVRVPYLRRYKAEQRVYDMAVTPTSVGKHVAPHSTEVAAQWAVLTRLKKPIADRYPQEVREIVDGLTPVEKLHLYEDGAAPDRLSMAQAKELQRRTEELYGESDAYPNYEGRTGASAREIKTALFNAAQNPDYRCLNPLAVLEELDALCQDTSVYEFLQQEVVEGYHDHPEFLHAAQRAYLDKVDSEVRESMGLVSEAQYRELFARYVVHVSHWVKNEKMENRMTGQMERPDEARMGEMEAIVMPRGDDSGSFRRGLISAIGAHRLDNPEGEMDYARIFPDLFRRLRSHFFEERKKALRRNTENILKYLSEDRGQLLPKEQQQVQATLKAMAQRYGYCDHCAKDAIVFLMRQRYAG